MAARKKGDTWYADFMVAGVRYREFSFPSKIEADTWEANARLALAKGQPLPSGPQSSRTSSITLGELVRLAQKNHWSRGFKSAAKLVRNAELYAEYHGTKVLAADGLSSSAVADYVEHLKDTERSGSTINRQLSSVSILVKQAIDLEVLRKPPKLPWQKEGEGRLRHFTRPETDQIFDKLRQWSKQDDLDLFTFLVDTGARVGEALGLQMRDVRRGPDGSSATFLDTKNGKNRTVPLTGRALAAVERKGGFAHLNRWGIRSTWDRLRTALPWLGTATIHTFRHTCASWLVQAGFDLYRVQIWMGHKSQVTTMRYAHLSPDHLKGMVNVLEAAE